MPLDRVLQRAGGFDLRRAQQHADIDQIAQHPQLHRRAARAMAAIGQNLRRQSRAREPRSARANRWCRTAERQQFRQSAPSMRAAAQRPSTSHAAVRARWRSCAADARQHRAAQGRSASRPTISRNARSRRRAGSPSRRSARPPDAKSAFSREPALHQRSRRVARRRSPPPARSAIQSKPCQAASHSRPRPRRKPERRSGCAPASPPIRSRRRGSPRRAWHRPASARPSLRPQVARNPADQRMAIRTAERQARAAASRRNRVRTSGRLGAAGAAASAMSDALTVGVFHRARQTRAAAALDGWAEPRTESGLPRQGYACRLVTRKTQPASASDACSTVSQR